MAVQVITYNGVSFPFNVMDISAALIYGEDRRTVIGTAYVFNVTGTITSDYIFEERLDDWLCTFRDALVQPRKSFVVTWDGVTQFNFSSANDIDFGPKPGEVKLFKFSGGRSANYAWNVTVVTKECWSGACTLGAVNAIIAITQQFTHHIDVNGLTTRTIAGKLIVSAQSVASGKPADSYRFAVTPPIPGNYRRVSYDFMQSPDGRELTYSIVDEEQVYTLPLPVTNGQATWTVSLDTGLMAHYRLSGFFEAPATVTKANLIQLVGELAAAKFPINEQTFIFETRTLSESVYTPNRVDFDITASSAGGVATDTGYNLNVGLQSFTVSPPGVANLSWPIYPDGGDVRFSSGTIAPGPVVWDACAASNVLTFAGSSQGGRIVGYQGGVPVPPEGPNPFQDTGPSTDHKNAPYIAYNEVVSWEIDNHVCAFSPKQAGAGPIIQQTSMPTITVIKAGYANRYGTDESESPKVPTPDTANYAVVNMFIAPEVAEPVGDGSTNRYSVKWRFVLTKRTPATDIDALNISYPVDPRRNASQQSERVKYDADLNAALVNGTNPP